MNDLPGPLKKSGVDTLIIGCGNLLRGDDAVGPVLIRHLWDLGLPEGVNCADGGTGGMDVAFQMRGVRHVVLIDACVSDSEPGAIFKLPGEAVETLPPLAGINLHAFRWDHALSFARWLLKEDYPHKITVYLIEAASLVIGEPLSEPVSAAMRKLAGMLLEELSLRDLDALRMFAPAQSETALSHAL
jgi:hydrogenase maturation protease